MKYNVSKGIKELSKLAKIKLQDVCEFDNSRILYTKLSRGKFSAEFFFDLVNRLGGTVVIEHPNGRIEFKEDGVYVIKKA